MKPPAVWKRPKDLPIETSLGDTRVLDVMMRYAQRRGTVIQAGAHVGLWPAVLSQYFDQVVSFEPVAKLAAAAREGAPYGNVKIFEMVLSDSPGQRLLSIPNGEKMARFSGSSAISYHGEPVEATTIDELAPELKTNLGAIVLDIEGHELPALRGSLQAIAEFRPVIVVEQNACSLRHRGENDVDTLLAPFGYERRAAYRDDIVFAVNWTQVNL